VDLLSEATVVIGAKITRRREPTGTVRLGVHIPDEGPDGVNDRNVKPMFVKRRIVTINLEIWGIRGLASSKKDRHCGAHDQARPLN
jgi:hypothetical protein